MFRKARTDTQKESNHVLWTRSVRRASQEKRARRGQWLGPPALLHAAELGFCPNSCRDCEEGTDTIRIVITQLPGATHELPIRFQLNPKQGGWRPGSLITVILILQDSHFCKEAGGKGKRPRPNLVVAVSGVWGGAGRRTAISGVYNCVPVSSINFEVFEGCAQEHAGRLILLVHSIIMSRTRGKVTLHFCHLLIYILEHKHSWLSMKYI